MVQNSDIKVRFTLTDGTNAYNISALNDYEVYIYTLTALKEKTLIATYKKSNAGKYGITVDDAPNGKIIVTVHRQDTINAAPGKLYAEIRLRLTATSEFVSSVQNVGATGIEVTTLDKTANTKNLL